MKDSFETIRKKLRRLISACEPAMIVCKSIAIAQQFVVKKLNPSLNARQLSEFENAIYDAQHIDVSQEGLPDPSTVELDYMPTYFVVHGKKRIRTFSVHEQEDGSILLIRMRTER